MVNMALFYPAGNSQRITTVNAVQRLQDEIIFPGDVEQQNFVVIKTWQLEIFYFCWGLNGK